jgi:hypothetical protein
VHVHLLTYRHVSLATAPGLEDSAGSAVTGRTKVETLSDGEQFDEESRTEFIAAILRDTADATAFQSSI